MSEQHPPPGSFCTCPLCCPAKYGMATGGITYSPDYKSEKPKVVLTGKDKFVFREPGDPSKSYEMVKAGTTVELHERVKDLERQRVDLKAEIDRLKAVIFDAYESDLYEEMDNILSNEIESWPTK